MYSLRSFTDFINIRAQKQYFATAKFKGRTTMKSASNGFDSIYNKIIKFYDFQYHLHKSTFKGLSSIIRDYSQCEKQYSSRILRLTQNIPSEIADLVYEMPAVRTAMKDFVQNLATISQLHFNYSQRLLQISNSLSSEYNRSKKLKEKHMRILKDQYGDNISRVKESGIRSKINDQESDICKKLYEHLDVYAEEEAERTQKLKEQILIYFALTKKISQKQLQNTSKYKSKLSQQEAEVKILEINEISQQLVKVYNSYNRGEHLDPTIDPNRLSSKNYDRMQSINITRESLKESTLLKQRADNLDSFKSKIKESLDIYEKLPQRLLDFNMLLETKPLPPGFFDQKLLKNSNSYSNCFSSQTFNKITFDMISSFIIAVKKEKLSTVVLSGIKANLKVKGQAIQKGYPDLLNFIEKQLESKSEMSIDDKVTKSNNQYKLHLITLVILSEIYSVRSNETLDLETKGSSKLQKQREWNENTLIKFMKSREFSPSVVPNMDRLFDPNIAFVIVKILLQSLIIIDEDEPILLDGFQDTFSLICSFAEGYFQMEKDIVKLILLHQLESSMRIANSNFVEEIELLIDSKAKKGKYSSVKGSKRIDSTHKYMSLKSSLIANIASNVTEGIVHFFQSKIPLINFAKILICLQNIQPQFSAIEYFNQCMRRSGFAYVFWVDPQKKIIEPTIWQGQLRLKNLVDSLEQIEYTSVEQDTFEPTAREMAQILGVDEHVILKRIKADFTRALGDIIENNLSLLCEQSGVDKDGYVLKLGVFLAQLDIVAHKSLDFQKKYLTVLELYLKSTENQYNHLLNHSRKTELWIMEENSLATQNCIDFCSLMYKPFEFLLSTLKILEERTKNDFTQQFSQFIKNRLNNILKDQICNYVNFLEESLNIYNHTEPQIHYKPKKGEAPLKSTSQDKKQMVFVFKEVVRRIYNLNFLKNQLDEILNDFLPREIFSQDLGNTIFNIKGLDYSISKQINRQYKSILLNLKQIVELITKVQEKIVHKVADISVFHFLRRFFYNLYFQESKSSFEEFFSSKSDYKLSPFTMISMQKQFEETFQMFEKHIPVEVSQEYYDRLMGQFFKALKYQIINSAKFKLPKQKEEIVSYLQDDIAFACNLLKQKHVPETIVREKLQKPSKIILKEILMPTKDLMQLFEAQTLKNNNQGCKYLLILLYLRPNDDKAQQFFKNYKATTFK